MLACRIQFKVLLRRTNQRIFDRAVVVRSVTTDEATTRKFKLSKSFIEKYKNKNPPFGE